MVVTHDAPRVERREARLLLLLLLLPMMLLLKRRGPVVGNQEAIIVHAERGAVRGSIVLG